VEIGVSLQTPDDIRRLQRTLYVKAKNEPAYRFYLLYDKVYREDILLHAYRVSRAARGAPGVDGVTFEDIGAAGVEEWLAGLRRALQDKTYRPVRRVLIPKPGREAAIDFTHATDLGVTIAGDPFPHLLFEFVTRVAALPENRRARPDRAASWRARQDSNLRPPA